MNWKHWQRILMKTAQSILSEKLYLEPKKVIQVFLIYILYYVVKETDYFSETTI